MHTDAKSGLAYSPFAFSKPGGFIYAEVPLKIETFITQWHHVLFTGRMTS